MKSEKGFPAIETMPALAIPGIFRRLRSFAFLSLIVITLLSFALPTPAEAQGLAISGTFYRQHFRLLPGETLRTPDIYLVVFNQEDTEITVKLTTQTPPGVEMMLDQSYFPIPSGEQQKIEVGVSISTEAVPGDYLLAVAVEVQPAEGEGIAIAGAAEQRAKLTILKEAGEVHNAEGVNPVAQKCFISAFSVTPSYYDDTDKIAFANIVYAIKNISQPLKGAKLFLRVFFNDELLEQVEIISLPTLALGDTSGSYKYIPSRGWQDGTYAFKLELFSQDRVCAQSMEVELGGEMPPLAAGMNWRLVGAVAGALLVIVVIVLTRKRLKKLVPAISVPITLRKKAISLEDPGFSGVFNEETGELIIVKITYGINNQHKPISGVRVELQVSQDKAPLENIILETLDPLDKGLHNSGYDYAPAEGWQKNAAYNFKLALYVADKLHTITPVHARAKSAS